MQLGQQEDFVKTSAGFLRALVLNQPRLSFDVA